MESYNNWVLDYTHWSLDTLPADIADRYLKELIPSISAMPDDAELYVNRLEWTLKTLAPLNRSKLLLKATNLSLDKDSLTHDKENLSHEIANLQAEIARLNGELNSLREELADRDGKIKEVYSSHSYKLGHALLTPLSAVKHRGEEELLHLQLRCMAGHMVT